MIKYADIKDAQRESVRWSGNPSTVEHLGDFGNSVFSFQNFQNRKQVLRFTDPGFRSFEELNAELNFVNHLHSDGVSVADSLLNTDGEKSYLAECCSGKLICSSVAFAGGFEVLENSVYWETKFFKAWGRNLAEIHHSSQKFKPDASEPRRWLWEDEILLNRAKQLIPVDDDNSMKELDEVMSYCRGLEKPSSEFGLIHADHAPQNFRFDPDSGSITAFDFGNCCYHWFMADVAISLSTIRRKQKRDKIREDILDGYSSIRSLPQNFNELLDWFIRLRVLYVYLSRLHLWSERRTKEQEKELIGLRSLVHQRTGWPS
jgi:Ser/Thr protein kinase RdoA (MazF antagonist)